MGAANVGSVLQNVCSFDIKRAVGYLHFVRQRFVDAFEFISALSGCRFPTGGLGDIPVIHIGMARSSLCMFLASSTWVFDFCIVFKSPLPM